MRTHSVRRLAAEALLYYVPARHHPLRHDPTAAPGNSSRGGYFALDVVLAAAVAAASSKMFRMERRFGKV